MDSLKVWKLSQVPLLGALSSELTVQRENLMYHLGDEWKRLIVWKLPPSNGTKSSAHMLNKFIYFSLPKVLPIVKLKKKVSCI